MNRRSFLRTTTAAGAGALALPRFSIGKEGPSANSKLNIAIIGTGGIARMTFGDCKGENIVALCDVDDSKLHEYAGRNPEIKKARTFTDFRVMLDKMGKEIDGVCINTPDHTHFVATLACMERGLHVCTQKPLTHNIWEARTLKKAKAKYKVVTNMVNQGHTYNGIREMREWYEANVFGQIGEVHCWHEGPGWGGKYFAKPATFPPPEHPVPGSLNYDLWLGPVPETPFNKHYHPRTWRGFHTFGGGFLADWFCHIADAPVWILDLYDPISVEAEKIEGGNDWIAPDGNRIRFDFGQRGAKAPCSLYWHNGKNTFLPSVPKDWTWSEKLPNKGGTFFLGEKHTAYTDRRSNHPRLANREAMKAFKAAGLPAKKYPRVSGGPYAEWIRAIKNEGPEPGANFDYAAPLTEVCLLGVLAARFGGRIEWDTKAMRITNRPALNAYIKEPVRPGWEAGEALWG